MILNLIISIFFVLVWFTIGYWAQDRSPPITVISEITETPVVNTGEVLQIRYQINRHRQCSLVLEHDIFDGKRIRHRLDTQEFLTSPGPVGPDEFAIAVDITSSMAGGRATYRSVRSYYCNPLQRWFTWPIVVTPSDIPFIIQELPSGKPLPPPIELAPDQR
jgi:hypothetical protein